MPTGSGDPSDFAAAFQAVVDNVELVVRGKTEAVSLALTCLFAGGHLLIEDVPGLGKTSLARCIAASLEASCHRIQFTPDLLPSDVTGVTVYHQGTAQFGFHPGPVFAHVVVADEVNRASPKTQSALLEVMEEGRVTVDGQPHAVPRPFFVVATQNPVDMDGTYALPEAQLDRFLMRVRMGYPDRESEVAILRNRQSGIRVEDLRPVLSTDEVLALVAQGARTHVADTVHEYVVDVVAATRTMPRLRLGASPRGSIALLRASQVRAAAAGRDFVTPDDVKALAVPVLAHRMLVAADAELRGFTGEDAVGEVLGSVPVPRSLAGV
ncbi:MULTISPECIES: MoxR family ATPase [unclassified Frankia]|uniref:AAA family ATPase n=1 Tax=unclassified Frankia TaxID=2632575 RepID=UPI002AD1DB45|nr:MULTISPECIES: MoxR family ATPase [unclassified Frankia]